MNEMSDKLLVFEHALQLADELGSTKGGLTLKRVAAELRQVLLRSTKEEKATSGTEDRYKAGVRCLRSATLLLLKRCLRTDSKLEEALAVECKVLDQSWDMKHSRYLVPEGSALRYYRLYRNTAFEPNAEWDFMYNAFRLASVYLGLRVYATRDSLFSLE